MKQNENILDRIVRILIALGLFYIGITWDMSSVLRIIVAIAGGGLIVTAVTGYCALYSLFGISTKKLSKDTKEPFQKGQ
jgi:uncharacterized membrane protein